MKADRKWWNDGRLERECAAADVSRSAREWLARNRWNARVPTPLWLEMERRAGSFGPVPGFDGQRHEMRLVLPQRLMPNPPLRWWLLRAP